MLNGIIGECCGISLGINVIGGVVLDVCVLCIVTVTVILPFSLVSMIACVSCITSVPVSWMPPLPPQSSPPSCQCPSSTFPPNLPSP